MQPNLKKITHEMRATKNFIVIFLTAHFAVNIKVKSNFMYPVQYLTSIINLKIKWGLKKMHKENCY